jgi:mannose-1-phosphate guanylyltransferase
MSPTSSREHKWAVVLAGGNGARLQELTRLIAGDSRPKQFCPLFDGKSLLTHTRERIAPVFDEDRILFALARAHQPFYREQLAEVEDWRKVIQPANRGTAVAMALCLRTIAQRDEDAVVAFFPSDHHYLNCVEFRKSVESALCRIKEYPHCLLLLGAEARYPEVEHGWIQPGRTLVDAQVSPLQRVSRFWEKPTLECARELQKRRCLWNTFVVIGSVAAFLEALQTTVPHLTRSLEVRSAHRRLDQLYDTLAPIDFSKAVLARIPERLVVQRDAASGWTDLGSPHRVIEVLSRHGVRPPWLASRRSSALDTLDREIGALAP